MILIRIVNKVKPDIVTVWNQPKEIKLHPLKERENIGLYLNACWKLGLASNTIFHVSDLYDKGNLSSVLNNLSALSTCDSAKERTIPPLLCSKHQELLNELSDSSDSRFRFGDSSEKMNLSDSSDHQIVSMRNELSAANERIRTLEEANAKLVAELENTKNRLKEAESRLEHHKAAEVKAQDQKVVAGSGLSQQLVRSKEDLDLARQSLETSNDSIDILIDQLSKQNEENKSTLSELEQISSKIEPVSSPSLRRTTSSPKMKNLSVIQFEDKLEKKKHKARKGKKELIEKLRELVTTMLKQCSPQQLELPLVTVKEAHFTALKHDSGRRIFSYYLSKRVFDYGAILIEINRNYFDALTKLTKYALDHIRPESGGDRISAKYILFSSYFVCLEGTDKKMNLEEQILTHPIWHSPILWEEYFWDKAVEDLEKELVDSVEFTQKQFIYLSNLLEKCAKDMFFIGNLQYEYICKFIEHISNSLKLNEIQQKTIKDGVQELSHKKEEQVAKVQFPILPRMKAEFMEKRSTRSESPSRISTRGKAPKIPSSPYRTGISISLPSTPRTRSNSRPNDDLRSVSDSGSPRLASPRIFSNALSSELSFGISTSADPLPTSPREKIMSTIKDFKFTHLDNFESPREVKTTQTTEIPASAAALLETMSAPASKLNIKKPAEIRKRSRSRPLTSNLTLPLVIPEGKEEEDSQEYTQKTKDKIAQLNLSPRVPLESASEKKVKKTKVMTIKRPISKSGGNPIAQNLLDAYPTTNPQPPIELPAIIETPVPLSVSENNLKKRNSAGKDDPLLEKKQEDNYTTPRRSKKTLEDIEEGKKMVTPRRKKSDVEEEEKTPRGRRSKKVDEVAGEGQPLRKSKHRAEHPPAHKSPPQTPEMTNLGAPRYYSNTTVTEPVIVRSRPSKVLSPPKGLFPVKESTITEDEDEEAEEKPKQNLSKSLTEAKKPFDYGERKASGGKLDTIGDKKGASLISSITEEAPEPPNITITISNSQTITKENESKAKVPTDNLNTIVAPSKPSQESQSTQHTTEVIQGGETSTLERRNETKEEPKTKEDQISSTTLKETLNIEPSKDISQITLETQNKESSDLPKVHKESSDLPKVQPSPDIPNQPKTTDTQPIVDPPSQQLADVNAEPPIVGPTQPVDPEIKETQNSPEPPTATQNTAQPETPTVDPPKIEAQPQQIQNTETTTEQPQKTENTLESPTTNHPHQTIQEQTQTTEPPQTDLPNSQTPTNPTQPPEPLDHT
uniref:Uncharacterized protein n=1 Tax=Arcella intermedia TaxID=1963864 RepID=A0A6B2KWV8_9EUKA